MKVRRKYLWVALAVALFLAIGSQSRITALAYAASKSTNHFLACASEQRVIYEPGAKPLAQLVADVLPEAISAIEERHYRPFASPVQVCVCASLDSFESYCPGVRNAAGCVINKRLFLSPKLSQTPERIPRIVTHELSHLHLQQRVGVIRLQLALPPWFQEGLAVHVSNGGGAERVTEDEARQCINSGKCFVPELSGSLLFSQEAQVHGLSHHMFYRQSAMFIDFLKNRDESKFRALLLGIEDGKSLGTAFREAYERDLKDEWQQFVAAAKAAEASL